MSQPQPTLSPSTKHQAPSASFLSRLHARIGDFWWYSLMVFCAARVADCMNVFVGLWLVPKYVDPKDLGAVMPLTQFAGCLAIPIAVFASTFRNEITELSIKGEFGKLKTLLRGTFVATGVFFVFAITVSYFLLPPFLERIRIANGSLGILVIITAFVGSVSPIFNNALQALKKFKATSVIGILGAPIRLLTMLATMPLRPLSGYFVGQTSTPAFGILASVIALKKELSVKAEPYWNKDVFRRAARFAILTLVASLAVSFWSLISSTILRQRLPEMESAAYYMVTRFSEISGFVSTTLLFTMFPFTAELARKGKSTNGIVLKVSLVTMLIGAVLSAFFWLLGQPLMEFLPHGAEYSQYYWAIPWLIGISVLTAMGSYYNGTEISAGRFGYLWWQVPLCIVYPVIMLLVTGYGYLIKWLPGSMMVFLRYHNIASLDSMLMWLTGFELIRVICAAIALWRNEKSRKG